MVGLQTRLGPDDRVEIAKLIRWLEVSADRRARGSASGSMSDTAELAPTRTRASSADFVAAMEARETPVAANPAVSVGASGQADGVEPAGRPNERRSATDTSRALQAASLYEAARADLNAGVLDRAIRDLQLAVAYDPTVAEYREALAQAEERAARPRA